MMWKSKTISVAVQKLIIQELKKGESQRKVAATFEVSKSCILGIITRYRKRGAVFIKKNPGRPPKTTTRQDRTIVKLSNENPRKSAQDINAEMK